MTHGSLFSGIGGFDLAAEWMGWQNVFHCEWNTFGQRVLKHYWPNATSYHDITKTDFTIHRGRIDILTGGFPCQPYSMAGKRLGKEDDRHLWPEMLRAIREIQPRWVVGENVLGLVNWSGGLVFHEVQADLEAEGYEVQPFVLPAVSVNAPHRRDRVWFVAHANLRRGWGQQRIGKHDLRGGEDEKSYDNIIQANKGLEQREDTKPSSDTISNGRQKHSGSMECKSRTEKEGGHKFTIGSNDNGTDGDATDTNGNGQHGCNGKYEEQPGEGREYAQRDIGESNDDGDATHTNGIGRRENERKRNGESNVIDKNGATTNWETFPTVSPICDGNDGISDRLDGITFSKWRQESIKAGGNAVVPHVVLQIFRTIEEYEKMNTP